MQTFINSKKLGERQGSPLMDHLVIRATSALNSTRSNGSKLDLATQRQELDDVIQDLKDQRVNYYELVNPNFGKTKPPQLDSDGELISQQDDITTIRFA
jgi:hypothetical protein